MRYIAKKSKKKLFGIVLVVLQILSLMGMALNRELKNVFLIQSSDEMFEFIGTFLIGIIGITLIIQSSKENKGYARV